MWSRINEERSKVTIPTIYYKVCALSISDLKVLLLAMVKFILLAAACLRVETCLLQPHSHLHHVATGNKVPLVEKGCYHLGDAFVIK